MSRQSYPCLLFMTKYARSFCFSLLQIFLMHQIFIRNFSSGEEFHTYHLLGDREPYGRLISFTQNESELLEFSSFGRIILIPSTLQSLSFELIEKKKNCGFPVSIHRLIGPLMKRSVRDFPHTANTEKEIEEKNRDEDTTLAKRRDHSVTEFRSEGCQAERQWIDMGKDCYPRYVKSYHCSSSHCDKGFGKLGTCKPKHYTTKVLKRIVPADSTLMEDCDLTLPESLRFDWKLLSVVVTTCCECASPSTIFGWK